MKKTIRILLIACISLICMTVFNPVSAYPSEGTQGDELQILKPSSFEIQLGSKWAGVEFMLKTDAGIYPGTIVVGNDGVLRLEIGGSDTYILSCLQSDVLIPEPELTQAPATKGSNSGTSSDMNELLEDDKNSNWPLIVFVVGIVAAGATLYLIYVYEKKRINQTSNEDDYDED